MIYGKNVTFEGVKVMYYHVLSGTVKEVYEKTHKNYFCSNILILL